MYRLFTGICNRIPWKSSDLCKIVHVKKNCAPWISRSIRKEMDKRNKLLRGFVGSKSPSVWNEFKCLRNLLVSLQQKAKIDHFQRLISKNTSSSTLWNILKSGHRLLLLPTGMLLAPSTLQLPTFTIITLSLSALPMHLFLLPLVLTPHPQPCPCHS